MKKILLTSSMSILSLCSSLFLSANNTGKDADPYATFDKLWIDYDVYDNSVKGMKIHVKFTAYEMLNMDAYVAIYFQRDDDAKTWLMDKNSKYNSTDGYVAVYKSIKPLYNPAVYEDLDIFMPYAEFDLEAGEYKLAMDVKLIYKSGGAISKLTTYSFEYSKPAATTTAGGAPAKKITATFKNMWVDFDIYEDGKKGMRIHTKFSVDNMKGTDGYLALYFEKKNGERLKSSNTKYRSASGQLAVYKLLTPGYDSTEYDDLTVFIPYSEFDLPLGKHDLKIVADIIFKTGGIIQHLKEYDFWMTK